MKKVIIVGAGVSGLAAACKLQKQGYEVEIHEKGDKPGGKMNQIEFDGFKFDVGPTIVMMPDVYREVFTYCDKDPEDYIPMVQFDPIYTLYFKDGTTHKASSNMANLIKELEPYGYQEAQGYLAYVADVYQRYSIAKAYFIEKSFRKKRDFYNYQTLRAGLKLKTFDNAYHSISKFVKSDKLQKMLAFQTLYIGLSPYNGPSIYTIIPMVELVYGVWYMKGGMYTMAKAMERLFIELGGRIVYHSSVDEIVIKDGKAVGILVGDTYHPGDKVIAAADFPYVVEQMLPDGFKHGKYKKGKMDNCQYSCSCFVMYLGLTTIIEDIDVHQIIFSQQFDDNINSIFEGKLPDDPSIYCYAPSVCDDTLAPAGKMGLYILMPLSNLQDATFDWHDEMFVNQVRRLVFDTLATIPAFAQVESLIESERIYTPNDFEQVFNAYKGATFGLKPTLLQSNYWRPQPKSMTIDNLYFCGSSAHPGAGVPIVLTSAQLVVAEVLKDEH